MGKRKTRKHKTRKTRKIRRRKNRTRKWKKDKCSPKKKEDILKYSCYTSRGLHRLKNIWNKKHIDRKIMSNNPKRIWETLKYILSRTCNKESCWLKHKCLKENVPLNIAQNTFAPRAPEEWKKKPDEWLSSIEILEVMKQHEDADNAFDFIGPSPIDYDYHKAYGECVWEELCEFSLADNLNKNKTKIGIIFNLDKHTKDGSHWVALFIRTKSKKIYYLDSYGEKMPRQIKKFVKKIQRQANSFGIGPYELIENKRRHQFSESECGMYCLYFIIQMIKGKSFNKFLNKRVKDSHMKKLRKKIF